MKWFAFTFSMDANRRHTHTTHSFNKKCILISNEIWFLHVIFYRCSYNEINFTVLHFNAFESRISFVDLKTLSFFVCLVNNTSWIRFVFVSKTSFQIQKKISFQKHTKFYLLHRIIRNTDSVCMFRFLFVVFISFHWNPAAIWIYLRKYTQNIQKSKVKQLRDRSIVYKETQFIYYLYVECNISDWLVCWCYVSAHEEVQIATGNIINDREWV